MSFCCVTVRNSPLGRECATGDLKEARTFHCNLPPLVFSLYITFKSGIAAAVDSLFQNDNGSSKYNDDLLCQIIIIFGGPLIILRRASRGLRKV